MNNYSSIQQALMQSLRLSRFTPANSNQDSFKLNKDKFNLSQTLELYLTKAFEEGLESPYDLKDEIVTELVEKLNKIIISEQTPSINYHENVVNTLPVDIANKLLYYLPKSIRETLQRSSKIFFSGGGLVRLLIDSNSPNAWNDSDWDIFISDEVFWPKLPIASSYHFKQSLKPYGDTHNHRIFHNKISKTYYNDKRISSQTPNNKYSGQINLIIGKFNCLQDVLNCFDFTFLQTGLYVDDSGVAVYKALSPSCLNDLLDRNIKLSNNSRLVNSQCKDRVKKYITRGFKDSTYIVEKGFISNKK